MPRPRLRGGRPRFRGPEGALAVVVIAVVASCFAATAASGPVAPPSPPSAGEPFFPLGPAGDCSPAGVSMAVFPLSREEAESCAGGAGGGGRKKEECRVARPAARAATPPAGTPAAETVFFSWSPLSESDSDSNSTTTTTTKLLDTTGTPVRPGRMPDALFSSSRGPAPPPSLRSSSPAPAPAPARAPTPLPPPALPSSFALVAGRLLLEAAGNYTFFLSSDGLSAMELAGAEAARGGSGSGGGGGAAAAPGAANATLKLARSPLKPLSLLLPSSSSSSLPRAVDFTVAYLPDPAAASHFLALEWEFREGGGGAALAGRPSSSAPRGNRRAIERGAVWPSALVGPKCLGPPNGSLGDNGGRKRKVERRSRRLLLLR